ncbi:MAG: HAD family hydrolase [Desulfuromonadaceae bacterium]|nr:HAD family hydrolase [Desulfuromonadaceae bacterium]
MSRIKGIIFDFDGVLFDSLRANLAYYNTVFRAFGAPEVTAEDPEKMFLCHTANSARVFEVLLGEKRRDEALAYAAALDFRRFVPLMEMEAGLLPALRSLRGKADLAVATNRGQSTYAILEHFDLARYFRTVVTCQDVARPKPDPEMLLLAASRLGAGKDEVLYVGDSDLDRLAAEAAGILFADYKGEAGGKLKIGHHSELVSLFLEGDLDRSLTISRTLPPSTLR